MDPSSGPAPGLEGGIMEIFTPEQIAMILTELGYTPLAPPIADPVEGASGSMGPPSHEATLLAQNESFDAGTTGQSTALYNSKQLQPSVGPYAAGNESVAGLNRMLSTNLGIPIDPELLSSEPSQPGAPTLGTMNQAYYYCPGLNVIKNNGQRNTFAAGPLPNEYFNMSTAGPSTVFNNLNQSYPNLEQNVPLYNASEPFHGNYRLASAHPDIALDPSLLMPACIPPEASTSGNYNQADRFQPDSTGLYNDEQQDAFEPEPEPHEQSIKPRKIRSERHQGLTCPHKGKGCKYTGTFHDKRCLSRHCKREHNSQPRPFLLCPGNCRDTEFSDEFSLHRHLCNENFVDCRRAAVNKGWIPTQQSSVKYLAD